MQGKLTQYTSGINSQKSSVHDLGLIFGFFLCFFFAAGNIDQTLSKFIDEKPMESYTNDSYGFCS
jgi:hypothetical protein